jgi:hypothetical protein
MPNLTDTEKKPSGTFKYQYNLIEDKVVEIKTVVVHEFRMGDVEDPDLMAGEPLWNWQQSEQGQWIMKHAVETPIWSRLVDHTSFGWVYRIAAKLTAKDLTYYYLKWGNNIDNR